MFAILVQYGALGVLILGLGAALWYLLKRQIENEEKLKARLDAVEQDLGDYLRADQGKMLQVIENNTKALKELREIIVKSNEE
jgi:uncharacterized protein HemX